MSRNSWHMDRQQDSLRLARKPGQRLDVWAEARFPVVARGRLAHQIRQDMWRALQSLRGFSPVIEVTGDADGLTVRAGGQIDSMVPKTAVVARIADLLADESKRSRWIRCAAHKGAA